MYQQAVNLQHCSHWKSVRCPMTLMALWPPLAWYCTPRITCAPKAGMGWNILLDSNGYQGSSYLQESLSNSICTSHATAAQFPFNLSWWRTHCKPFFMHHCPCTRAWLLAFSSLKFWFGNGMDETEKAKEVYFPLPTIYFKKVKPLQSTSSSGRQSSSVSFTSNFGDSA